MVSGILPILALALRHRGPLTLLTAKLVAELATECEFLAVWPGPASPSDPTASLVPFFGPQRSSVKASATRVWLQPCCRC